MTDTLITAQMRVVLRHTSNWKLWILLNTDTTSPSTPEQCVSCVCPRHFCRWLHWREDEIQFPWCTGPAEGSLTLDKENRRWRSRFSHLGTTEPPQHLHRPWRTYSSTGEVEGNVGKDGHILWFLDEVRDSCRTRGVEVRESRRSDTSSVFKVPPSTIIQAELEESVWPWCSTSHQYSPASCWRTDFTLSIQT